jgi:hypothetical protein
MDLEPKARENLYSFAYTMLQSDQVLAAMKAFRVFVRAAPTDERAWLGLAACHETLQQNDIAAELYGAGAVIAEPPSVRCYLGASRLAADDDVALELLQRAGTIAENSGDDELRRLVFAHGGVA